MSQSARLLLAACLLPALGTACSSDVPPPTPGPSPTAPGSFAPTPTPTPTPGLRPSPPTGPTTSPGPSIPTPEPTSQADIDWRLASTGGEFSTFDAISGVASIGAALVAVGTYDDDSRLGGAAAWFSLDGLLWQRAQPVPRAGQSAMEAVTAGPAGLVAVGWTVDGNEIVPAVWLSADGREWLSVQDSDLERGQMTAVAANPLGYVALGFDPETDGGLAWSSRDGRDWSAAMSVPDFEIQPSVNDVIALGDGFIAYGSTARDERAALWTSLDGRDWERVLGLHTSPSSTINSVTASGTRLVAVGASYLDEGTVALAWTSEDGLDWLRVLDEESGETGEMLSVVPVRSGFLAVGSIEGEARGDLRAAVWWSPDGFSWHREPEEPIFAQGRMLDVLRAGAGLVVLGERADDPAVENFRPAVWLGTAR